MTKGLDISVYQTGVSFNIMKEKNIDFLILRGGYTSNGAIRRQRVDSEFAHFYDKTNKYKIPRGAYYYSCASNYDEGKAEAIFFYNECLRGRVFEYPVYIDVEDNYIINAGRRNATDAVRGFCEYLEARNYYVGIYTGYYIYINNLIPEELARYTLWGAWWKNGAPPKKLSDLPNFHMWQYSGGGVQIGSYGVDGDKCFVDFPGIIVPAGMNGWKEARHGKV